MLHCSLGFYLKNIPQLHGQNEEYNRSYSARRSRVIYSIFSPGKQNTVHFVYHEIESATQGNFNKHIYASYFAPHEHNETELVNSYHR